MAGHHRVRVYTNGNPTDVEVDIRKDGRRASSSVAPASRRPPARRQPAPDGAPVAVEFRVVGTPAAQVRIDDGRHSVRLGDVVHARRGAGVPPALGPQRRRDGDLGHRHARVVTGAPVVVQIAEGRVPEVSGSAAFHAGGG